MIAAKIGGSAIVDLEATLDAALVDRRTVASFTPDWLPAGKRWSAAVWEQAVALGPLERTGSARDTIAFARRAVFICGAHRSGTTFVRDLLDGHPALCVLPAETAYFGAMERTVADLPRHDRIAHIGHAWLRRLVNPISQPPFWLLGRSTAAASPYVDFARAYIAATATLRGADIPAADLAAIARAYATVRGQQVDQLAWWVEKTPGTERHLARICREFPQARIVHIVRDPDDAARSYRALLDQANGDAGSMTAMLRELIASFSIARRTVRSADPGRYLLVRYDALAADRPATIRRIAHFLAIDDHSALARPSIAGLPASPNSSLPAPPHWSPIERAWLAAARCQYGKLLRALD